MGRAVLKMHDGAAVILRQEIILDCDINPAGLMAEIMCLKGLEEPRRIEYPKHAAYTGFVAPMIRTIGTQMKVPVVCEGIGAAGGAEEHMIQLIILRIQHDLINLVRQAVQEGQKLERASGVL